MSIRRIDDKFSFTKQIFCQDPHHRPLVMICLKPGSYENICPSCKQKTIFVVPNHTLSNIWTCGPINSYRDI